MAIRASNAFAVEAHRVQPVDFTAEHAPTTQTYHGFSIQIAGVTIGRITEWTPVQMDRDVTLLYELNAKTWGQPVDAVPGKANSFTIAFTRAEVWGEEIEKAFGATDVYTLLTNQSAPFAIDEVYMKGSQRYRHFRYLGCWFSSKGTEGFSSEGDAIIKVSGDITFVNRVRLDG